jgi:soluble lytic murein transglycosylase
MQQHLVLHQVGQVGAVTESLVADRAHIVAGAADDPARNVELGTRYLRQLLDRYDGNLPKALAAYNGGEDAVEKWEARAPGRPDDEFVERISFRETRGYVKSVLGNYRHYRRLYGAPGEQRSERSAADAAQFGATGRRIER